MLSSSIGYYSLVFGLCVSLPIVFFSIQSFRDTKVLDHKILVSKLIEFLKFLIEKNIRIKPMKSPRINE